MSDRKFPFGASGYDPETRKYTWDEENGMADTLQCADTRPHAGHSWSEPDPTSAGKQVQHNCPGVSGNGE